jgi:hypothetical protein
MMFRGYCLWFLLYTSIKRCSSSILVAIKAKDCHQNVYLCKQNGVLYWSTN